jgi:hypothetical protein
MFAYLMFIAGAIFFIGGILETLSTTASPEWFLLFPYQTSAEPYTILGLALTIGGIALIALGIGMGLFYAHDRSWYMQELYKAHSVEMSSVRPKRQRKRNGTKATKAITA